MTSTSDRTTQDPWPPLSAGLSNTHPALRYCWHPVARSADVADRPVRVLLLAEPWVLVRLGPTGGVRAFFDRCPHRLAPLSLGSVVLRPTAVEPTAAAPEAAPEPEPALQCAYHGWCFGADGRCVDIPALGVSALADSTLADSTLPDAAATPAAHIPPRAKLRVAHGVAERHGMVFLCPTAPPPGLDSDAAASFDALQVLPDVEEADDPGFMPGDLPVMRASASAGLLADNFLDMAHFPFVHAATFGAEDPVVPALRVERDAKDPSRRWSFTATSEHPFSNREDPGVAEGIREVVQQRRVTYRVHAPFHLVLRLDFLDAGGTNVIGFFLQPETEDRCRIFSTIWRDDLAHDPARMASAVDFEVKVVEEDLGIQEAYDVRALPLDPTVEVHTRADRTTLELRRMLSDLVEAARAATGSARQPTQGAT